MAFRKKRKNEPILLAEGIRLSGDAKMETGSWLQNCLVKSLLTFSIVFGALGCFISALEVEYYVIPVVIVLVIGALFFAAIYYRGWLMDLIYILFGVGFFFAVRGFRPYINGGYYLIYNGFNKVIENYFDLPGMQYYEVEVENEAYAVTIVMIFIGIVMTVIANVLISRMMNPYIMALFTSPFWMIPLYFRMEPDAFFAILLLAGLFSMWTIRSSGAYGIERKYRQTRMKNRKKKPFRIQYVQDAQTMLGTMGVVFGAAILLYGLTAIFTGKNTFNIRYEQNPNKLASERFVQRLATAGPSMFDRYRATGGLANGQLGGVGSVSPDYQTDLVVRLAPYNYNPVYFKGFTGIDYISKESRWTSYEERMTHSSAITSPLFVEEQTEKLRGETYENSDSQVELLHLLNEDADADLETAESVGRMLVQNRGAAVGYAYAPYYALIPAENRHGSRDVNGHERKLVDGIYVTANNTGLGLWGADTLLGNVEQGQWISYDFYPQEKNVETVLSDDKADYTALDARAQAQAKAWYMEIPQECREALQTASDEAGITASDSEEEIIAKLENYFATEFRYTTRPGRTPEDEDFIAWFIENKKGYCAHFASAATLILRYNGIPARYVEGYVMTIDDLLGGELVEGADTSAYVVTGATMKDTAVVEVEITDARAHAWVEAYREGYGWEQEEFTVAAVDPEEEYDNFWEEFGSDGAGDGGAADGGFAFDALEWNADNIQGIFIALLVVLVVVFLLALIRVLLRAYANYKSWHTEDANENMLAYYGLIMERLRRKDVRMRSCPTYQEELALIRRCMEEDRRVEEYPDYEFLTKTLERGAYSSFGAKQEDIEKAMGMLRHMDAWSKRVRRYKNEK